LYTFVKLKTGIDKLGKIFFVPVIALRIKCRIKIQRGEDGNLLFPDGIVLGKQTGRQQAMGNKQQATDNRQFAKGVSQIEQNKKTNAVPQL